MKYLATFFVLVLSIATISVVTETAQTEARELRWVAAKGIPECLYVGQTVEARVWPEPAVKGDAFDLTVQTDSGKVSATPARAKNRAAPVSIAIRGEKVGRERMVIRAPGRPYVAPLTAFIRIVPSIEPPRELTTQVTDNVSRIGRYAEMWMAYDQEWAIAREVVLGWQSKDGVGTFVISLFTSQQTPFGSSFHVSGSDNSYVARVPPGASYYWRIKAFFGNCEGDAILTPESPFVPFDA